MVETRKPFLPIAILENDRWTIRDLWSFFKDANPEPDRDEETARSDPFDLSSGAPLNFLPLDALRQEAEALGVRILDLRGMDRKGDYPFRNRCVVVDGKVCSFSSKDLELVLKHPDYAKVEDFGIWGWFNDDEPKINQPRRGRAQGMLKWSATTTTIIHTMDVEAAAPRCIGIPVQSCVAQDASIVLCHPINTYLWSAHAANKYSSSIEISGKKGAVTDEQIDSGRILLRYDVMEKQRHFECQRYIAPHAFSHWSRKGDPGRKIWTAIAEWGIRELGLKLGPVVDTGTQPNWVEGTPVDRRKM